MDSEPKVAVGCVGIVLAFMIVVVLVASVGAALGGTILYLAWNFVIHAIWHNVPPVTFWQAFLLALLLSFLGGCFKAARRRPAIDRAVGTPP